MKLLAFLQKENKTLEQASKELGCSYEDVRRYSQGLVIPRPDRMKKITEWSNGEVQPNDWYKEE